MFPTPRNDSHTAEQLRLEVHGIEGVGNLIVVGLDLACSERKKAHVSNLSLAYFSKFPFVSLPLRGQAQDENCFHKGDTGR